MFDKRKFEEALARVEAAKEGVRKAKLKLEKAELVLKGVQCKHENVELDPLHEDLRALVGYSRGKCKDCGADVGRHEDSGSYGPSSVLEPGWGR